MFDSIRVRLTVWHLAILAVLQALLCVCIYDYISFHLNQQVNGILGNVLTSVDQALGKPEVWNADPQVHAANALKLVKHTETPIAIYDATGNLMAERPSGAAHITHLVERPLTGTYVGTESENLQEHLGARRVAVRFSVQPRASAGYFIAASTSLFSRVDELRTARIAFLIGVPFMLVLTGLSGWILTGRSLTPAVLMAERARSIGADNMSERLTVLHPYDELGRLALALNELLDRLAAASVSERQFMADAAHELRTPLSIAQTATTVTLMNTDGTFEEYRSALQAIDNYLQRLSRSVNDVFRLARADAGFKSLHVEDLYLDEVVFDAVKAARMLATHKNITIGISTMESCPYRGDEALLHEMMLNLLENSIKYTRPCGNVTVKLMNNANAYEISITDTGIGISEVDRDRIFQRFYRGGPATMLAPQKVEGTGLGLSIAQWIATSHLGTLELTSSGQHGSTFVVRLPCNGDGATT